MKHLLLIFLFTVLILLIGLIFGYNQFDNPYSISQSTKELAQPLTVELDVDFIRKKSF